MIDSLLELRKKKNRTLPEEILYVRAKIVQFEENRVHIESELNKHSKYLKRLLKFKHYKDEQLRQEQTNDGVRSNVT